MASLAEYFLNPSIGIHIDRARGPYVEAVANGMMLSAGLAFAGLILALDQSRRWRFTAACAIPVTIIAIVLTLTRAVWIGAALATIAAALVVPRMRRWLLPGAITVALGILSLLVAFPSFAGEAATEGAIKYQRGIDLTRMVLPFVWSKTIPHLASAGTCLNLEWQSMCVRCDVPCYARFGNHRSAQRLPRSVGRARSNWRASVDLFMVRCCNIPVVAAAGRSPLPAVASRAALCGRGLDMCGYVWTRALPTA